MKEVSCLIRNKKENSSFSAPPTVYFSSNTYALNYYFLAQLFHLSQFSKGIECNYVIILNDFKKTRGQISDSFQEPTAKISDIYKIMAFFGIKEKNVEVHKLSEGWRKYLSYDEEAYYYFLENMIFFKKPILEIPKEQRKLEFIGKKKDYQIHYLLQKYVDFLISSNYNRIFPDEFGGDISCIATSGFSYPILKKIQCILKKQNVSFEKIPEVYSLPPVLFFGKSLDIYEKIITPHINMTLNEINQSIQIYELTKKQINQLNKELIYPIFKYIEKNSILIRTKTNIRKLGSSSLSLSKARFTLAENMFELFKAINQILTNNPNDPLKFPITDERFIKTMKILSGKNTTQIILLCNGENRVGDISKKLNLYQPNVSSTISKLKTIGLIKSNSSGLLIRTTDLIDIEFKGTTEGH